ncbi:MAG: DUF1080 domain-containing protein [Acidobacteriales bacterium]|nr:DUF1080 domain-containing protein [Terriglobales bacterium]
MKALRTLAFLLAVWMPLMAGGGFQKLFNGKSLEGWTTVGQKGPGYIVEKGKIVCPKGGGGNMFYTRREYANFVLRLEYRMEPGGNNGVGIRAPLQGRISQVAMEIQILDDESPRYKGKLREWQYNGSIYGVIAARGGQPKMPWKWNKMEIRAEGRRIQVRVNGRVVVDGDLGAVTDPKVLAAHPGIARTKGYVGFLGHDTNVEFRKIEIKELP